MAGLLDFIVGSDDPSTADPATGLLDSQRRQLAFSTLGNIGATLLAAGQDIMPGQRANILAQLGNVPGNTMQMQSQLIGQNALQQRMARDKRQEGLDNELAQVASTPEFLSAIKDMPPDMQRIVPALVKSGRARDAITMVDNWRTNQAREKSADARMQLQMQAQEKPTVRELNGQLYQVFPDGRATLIPTTGGKPVDNSLRDDLNKSVTPMRGLMSLAEDFKDDYAGYKVGAVGDVVNALGRNLPSSVVGSDTGKQAQWWQSYQEFANLKRNALFGSALTATEKTEFDKAMINPGMDPGMIRENLRKQTAIAKSAVARIAGSAKEGGINPKALEALMGMTFDEVGSPMTPPPAAVQGAQQGGAHPYEGRTATGPNGQKIMMRGGQWVPVQ